MIKQLFRTKSVQHILDEAEKGLLEGGHAAKLNRTLTVRDLTSFGIAAVIGAGIFSRNTALRPVQFTNSKKTQPQHSARAKSKFEVRMRENGWMKNRIKRMCA